MQYLQHLFVPASRNLTLVFRSGLDQLAPVLADRHFVGSQPPQGLQSPTIELRVLTPQFYRQMVTYRELTDFLAYTLSDAYEENRTARSTDATWLVQYLESLQLEATKLPARRNSRGALLRMIWNIFRRLRANKQLMGSYPNPGLPKSRSLSLTPSLVSTKCGSFFLDDFVRDHCRLSLQLHYCYSILSLQLRARLMGVIGGE